MTPERWAQVEELCYATLERPTEERDAFLHNACAGDVTLRGEVESLLAEESREAVFMRKAAFSLPLPVSEDQGALVGQRLGHYAIGALLGVGGMGEVYRAHDHKLARDVAIKVLPSAFTATPDRRVRFEREARALAALNHPNIGAIYGIEDAEGVQALVLELIEGETLAERLERASGQGGALAVAEALAIARQISDAVEAAHEKGVVHRDLKPANIKITPEGIVKVLDFGLAQVTVEGAPPDQTERRGGAIVGTAAYMSPEQARGRAVDKRCDIWAFGCVLYEMFTGRLLFPGKTISETLAKILEHEPDWSILPVTTPPSIRRLLRRCLVKDPKHRLRDMGDVRLELEVQDEVQESISRGQPLPQERQKPAWPPWVTASALAAALLWMLWTPRPQALPTEVLRLRTELGGQVPLAPFTLQFGGATAISPAGDTLAFVGQADLDSPRELFVRRLDQLQAIRLPGTDDALLPFFSPDGEWIGFFAASKLKKVATSGGAVVTLADAPSARGGSWSDDGTIVFSPHQIPGTRLMRVASDGGDAEPLGSLADGEAIQISPQVLRGGTAVLYTSSRVAGSFNDADLVVEVVPGGSKKIIQRGAYHGRYLNSGHLAYVHDGTLFVSPFDLNRLEVTGPAVPAVDEIISNAITGGVQFSVSDTGTLAYLPGRSIGTGTPLHWMERSGNTTLLRVWPANWFNLAFAPDGRRVAMEIRERTSDIAIYEWARDTLTTLTQDPGRATKPVWTPDGSRIAFASTRADKSAANLYWQRADGRDEPKRLTTSVNQQEPTSWHPSGAFLAFEETQPPLNLDVMILPFEGSDATGWKAGQPFVFVNSPYIEGGPAFSPDGKWLAYSSKESGREEVYVRPFPGAEPKWQISTDGGTLPTWSRSKPELFFGANSRIMVTTYTVKGATFEAEKPQLWSEGRYQTRGANRMFDLHPDGQRFALAPAPQSSDSPKQDHVFLVLNFFQELRRAATR